MESFSVLFFRCTIFLVLCSSPNPIYARDTITPNTPLRDDNANQTLVSAGGIFELGFFTPPGSTKSCRYVGIWYYNLYPRRIVWVANRDHPIPLTENSSGITFRIAEDGKLKLFSNETAISGVEFGSEAAAGFNRAVKLWDNGNLVLFEGSSPSRSAQLWQSFDLPTDTFLPGMKLDDQKVLASWKNPTDPECGQYIFRREEGLYTIQNGSDLYWRSGEPGLSKIIPDKIHGNVTKLLSGSLSKQEEREYKFSGIIMNSTGEIQYYSRDNKGGWTVKWSEPRDACSLNSPCGKFSVCNISTNLRDRCKCLNGFQPDSSSGHCERRPQTRCDESKFWILSLTNFGGSFQPFENAKSQEDCEKECVQSCDCVAYYSLSADQIRNRSSDAVPLCYIAKDLENLRTGNGEGDFKLHVRVTDVSSMGISSHSLSRQLKEAISIIAVIAAVILVCCFSYNIYRRKWTTKGKDSGEDTGENPTLWSSQSSITLVPDSIDEDNKSGGVGVPFYSWESILAATEKFSDVHKLGRGGFGPVYKGTFSGGREMAVKRLSSYSTQGTNEFRNEVVLISKLQHRNLVRLLGYCTKDNEKILLYEYMPNKSLDAFIFDKKLCMLLNWKKRFEIILGMARGVLYLHQDSRLRIIHRDLKTSNILLDEEMNPKISDFGLARIVEGKGTEASTNRVVGTYGYMSPEYALDGLFSIKSDVFSFGVVLLEIISGKRNTGLNQFRQPLNLVGYAWGLWAENKALELLDPMLLESCEKSEVLKCINIGLLCVQEDPNDRPTMVDVVFMLSGQATTLPIPTQPAFVVRKCAFSTSSSSSTTKLDITTSTAEGR